MRVVLAAAFVAGALLTGQAAAEPADPIVGTWRFGSGTVQVVERGSGFVGRVVTPIRLAVCPHAAGELMWRLESRGSNYYRGTHRSFDDGKPGCGDRVQLAASWSLVTPNRIVLRVAELTGHSPGACGSFETLCFTLTRSGSAAGVPAVTVKLNGVGGETVRGSSARGLVLARGGDTTKLDVVQVRREGADTVFSLRVARSSAAACPAGSTGTLRIAGYAATIVVCHQRTELRGTSTLVR